MLIQGTILLLLMRKKWLSPAVNLKNKMYYHHSGFPGGIKSISFDKLQEKNPVRIIELAVKGMLPKNPLGREMYRKLKVYVGNEHPHAAQQPKQLEIEE